MLPGDLSSLALHPEVRLTSWWPHKHSFIDSFVGHSSKGEGMPDTGLGLKQELSPVDIGSGQLISKGCALSINHVKAVS